MQIQAENSRFDDYARRDREVGSGSAPVEVAPDAPHLKETIFNPNDPNGDWGGNVARPNVRKQYGGGQVQKASLVVGSTGFAPGANAPVSDAYEQNTKKHFETDISYMGVQQPPQKGQDMGDGPLGTNVYQMGPGGRHDANDWQTSYQEQSVGQFMPNENGRGAAPGKKKVVPAYEQVKLDQQAAQVAARRC